MSPLRLALVQHDIVWESPLQTFAHLLPWLDAAQSAGARLVLLSEMFSTGFSMQTEVTAEAPDGPSTSWLRDQAASRGLWLAGSVAVRQPGESLPYNTFTLAGPAGELSTYSKIHPFTYGGEGERFAAGSTMTTVDVEGVRVTPFVCYDLRFADVFWERAAQTDLYLVPANWPQQRRLHWTRLLQARAIENQAYVAGCNRVGNGGGLDYVGDSRVVDPMGEVLASAAGGESLLLADVDPAVVTATRERFPFQSDRSAGRRSP